MSHKQKVSGEKKADVTYFKCCKLLTDSASKVFCSHTNVIR